MTRQGNNEDVDVDFTATVHNPKTTHTICAEPKDEPSKTTTTMKTTVLQQRLSNYGIPFINMKMIMDIDAVNKDIVQNEKEYHWPERGEEKKETSLIFDNEEFFGSTTTTTKTASPTVVEIKTLIWKVEGSSREKDREEVTVPVPIQSEFETYYIATASRIQDKIKVSALRNLVQQYQQEQQGTIRISMAPQHMAESLTGFRSGSIPPIGHSTPLPLFVEESILWQGQEQEQQQLSQPSSEKGKNQKDEKPIIASIGSGVLGYSLLLPMSDFCQVAAQEDTSQNGNMMMVGSFRQGPEGDDDSYSKDENDNAPNPMVLRQQLKQERSDRRPAPKDRLKEYQSFNSIWDKAKLLRSTARKQGRIEEMKDLIEQAVADGDFPDLFPISVERGMGKNALHVCAWRGDLESVQLMIETAKKLCPDLDLVNMISEGLGNYGKTPIFFALTQCREDVVRYLVEQGANLLIVNNKGQTPCSIAVTHLKEDACEFLFNAEAEQLKNGKFKFVNYRENHSDGKLYGDLDPRFPIDTDNIGIGDLSSQMTVFQRSIQDAPKDSIFDGIPSKFEPRSLRPTVRWWVREARSLAEANSAGYNPEGPITFTQPRQSSAVESPPLKTQQELKSPLKAQIKAPTIKMESLPKLTLADVFNNDTLKNDSDVSRTAVTDRLFLVDTSRTIDPLEDEVHRILKLTTNDEDDDTKSKNTLNITKRTMANHDDDIWIRSTWAVDCEWKPSDTRGRNSPVATLQLSTNEKAFLLDLQTLCQDYRTSPKQMTEEEKRLNDILLNIFHHSAIPVVGYGILQDLGKMAASFPHMPCFAKYHSVIDLQSVSTTVVPKFERGRLTSLQRIAAFLLQKRMDKTEQCSDWTQRPLSQNQMDYALLDAAVLPFCLRALIERNAKGYNGQFFKIHSNLLSSVMYTRVESAPDDQIYQVPMGSIKTILDQDFARQCWPSSSSSSSSTTSFSSSSSTTHHDHLPGPPKLVAKPPPAGVPRVTKKEKAHLLKVGNKSKNSRPKPVQLKTLDGNLDNLPIPGITLGYTKESCVYRIVGHRLLNTFPEGTHIGFNRRSGVVETTNAWIVFCNFGTRPDINGGKPFSDFLNGGRELSFRLNPKARSGTSSEATLYRALMKCHDRDHPSNDSHLKEQTLDVEKKIFLFARDGTRTKYLFCGSCRCTQLEMMDCGSTSVIFELLQFDDLMGKNRISSDFQELIFSRQRQRQNIDCNTESSLNQVYS